MATKFSQKAPFNDWWYWSEQTAKRFRTISDIYREHGETERADTTGNTAKQLKEVFVKPITEMRKGMRTDEQKLQIRQLEEEAIFAAVMMLRDVLANFPFVSGAIQDFTGSKWTDFSWAAFDQLNSRSSDRPNPDLFTADTPQPPPPPPAKHAGDRRLLELFCGPRGRTDEGIRSGKVADGGLPGILYNMLLAERTGSNRTPTDYGKTMLMATQAKIGKTASDMVMNPMKPGGSI